MIIECVNCNKNFLVDSSLIPSSGRSIQCGSCNHIWFFKKQKETFKNIKPKLEKKNNIQIQKNPNLDNKKISVERKQNSKKNKTYELTKYKAKSNFSFVTFLSYLLVLIISLVALIIILDTFKGVLYKIFPNLEFFLYNFYEVLKDIELFIKDLIKHD